MKAVLALGFTALAIAVLAANASPAHDYELSIYGGTPLVFWVGVAIAIGVSLIVAVARPPGRLRSAAIGLGGTAVAAIAALPVLRGYYYHGTADALTHLGWVRDLATGAMAPTELFYPGIHSVAVLVSSFTGIELERAVLFVVAALAAVALVFVPLVVRRVSTDDRAVVVAAFAAFLLFMVHNLGVYLHAHAFAQATFFSALVLFLVVTYLTGGPRVATGVLLALASLAVIVYHPQQAANLIVVFGAICLVQLVARRVDSDRAVTSHRTLYAHTGFLVVAWALWVVPFEGWASANLARVQHAVVAYLSGTPPDAGGMAQSQISSLSAIGAGIPVMFVKLFLVAAIFTVLAVALMAAALFGIADESRPDANAVALYLGVGSLLLLPVIVAYFAGNIAEHYFRHIGFLLLIAAIVGSLALTRGLGRLAGDGRRRWPRVAIVIAFAIMLPLSLATVFPSPFIHKQTQHVTEPGMDGYRTVLDINDESLTLGGVRQAPWRFSDAIEGVTGSTRYSTTVSAENLTRLGEYYGDGGYLVVTDRDRQREVGAYEGLRYEAGDFASLDRQPGVNQVVSNGALTLYHVPEARG